MTKWKAADKGRKGIQGKAGKGVIIANGLTNGKGQLKGQAMETGKP